MSHFADREITCRDCKSDFVFTAEEQEFFASKDYTDPKRCKPCRDVRRAMKDQNGGRRDAHRNDAPRNYPPQDPVVEKRRGGGRGRGGRGRRKFRDEAWD